MGFVTLYEHQFDGTLIAREVRASENPRPVRALPFLLFLVPVGQRFEATSGFEKGRAST